MARQSRSPVRESLVRPLSPRNYPPTRAPEVHFPNRSSREANGNRTQTQDARGYLTSTVYDALDRVWVQIDALNYRVTQAYNPVGQPTTMTDPRGNTVVQSYNNRGLFSGIANELGYLRTVTYDPAARVQTEVSFGGQTTMRVYDPFRPEFLLLDEPSSGLDQIVRRDALKFQSRSFTILRPTHLSQPDKKISSIFAETVLR